MSIGCKFATAAEARKGNWFSRRHQTSEAHRDASEARKDRIQAQREGTMDRVAKQDEYALLRQVQKDVNEANNFVVAGEVKVANWHAKGIARGGPAIRRIATVSSK